MAWRRGWGGGGGGGVGLSPRQPHGQRPHHADTPALAWPMDLGHHYTTAGYQELHSLKKKKDLFLNVLLQSFFKKMLSTLTQTGMTNVR